MIDSNTGMPAPRHARVLPSFAVAFVARPLESVLGLIEGPELLAWAGQALPSERTAEELREQFVRRRRVSFDLLWTSVINVKIVEHWRRALTDAERLRLLPLVSSEEAVEAFPRLTLRAFKEGVRMPVGQALGVLAKLEALYWIQKPWRRRMKWGAKPQSLADVPVDIEFAERMKTCLASPWIDELDQEDLRFPSADKQKHSEWLLAELAKPVLSAPTHDLCQRLLAADKASWAEELADLVSHAIETAQRRPGSEESRQRWIDIFLARHGGVRGLELQGVGDRFSITRERVRQICDAILISLKAQPVKMPALEKLLRAAARVMPLPMQEADVQLARFLGDETGLAAAMGFAEEMGLESPVRRIAHGARTLAGRKPIHIVEAAAAPATWVNAALVHARRDCTFVGCTNYVRIAGLVAMEEGVALDAETLEAVFSKAPGFRILDKDSGWFTLADSEQSAAASRMRKLMCVATGSVGIDTVASALMTDDRWLYREDGRTLALPPLHVLAELFQGWSWLEANSHNKYTAKVPLDPQALLSKSELGAIAALDAHGGAATRAEVAAHLVGNLGVSNVAVSHVLATSSALCKLDHAIYGVGGRPLAAQALLEARARRTTEQLAHTPAAEHAGKEINLSLPVRTTVTQSGSSVAVKLRVVYLPSYLAGKITGRFEHATQVGAAISVKSGNQIRMLAKVADDLGVGPGERFEIVFDVQKRTYEISSPATIAPRSSLSSSTEQAPYAPGELSA
ncbi:hypothetical protein D3C87_1063580 [compost metagenome]